MILDASVAGNAAGSIDDGVVVASVFHVGDRRVHGPDADDLTMLIDALEAWRQRGHEGPVDLELSEDERPIVAASLPWLIVDGGAKHVAHRFHCGAAVLVRGSSLDEAAVAVDVGLRIVIEADAHDAITTAWSTEMAASNVSQGAYVSGQVHDLGLEARLGMQAQAGPVWPPRGALADGGLPEHGACLSMTARVVSWTRLIAAGCPSEFAIRAPALGGLTSMILSFEEGPSGVFLHADGHDNDVNIGDDVQLVVRRVYAQDGVLRYGRKAIRA